MSNIEQAIMAVIMGAEDEVFIRCTDEKNRNVLRTTAFRIRDKMQKHEALRYKAQNLGTTNEEIDGQPFLHIYTKPALKMYVKDKDGNLVPFTTPPEQDPDSQRTFKMMVQAKEPREEILQTMTAVYGWEESYVVNKLKELEPLPDLECNEPAFPQDILVREKLSEEDLK